MRLVQNPAGPFWVWDQDHLGQVIESGAFWDGQLLPAMEEALAARPNTWALDLGASVGVFTVWLAKRFAHVLAVEMHAGTFELLQRNLVGHGVADKVLAWNLAAYDRRVLMSLTPAALIGWPVPEDLNQTPNASSIALLPDPEGAYLGVAVDTLVPLDADVGLIKVDVQGCDLRALHGLDATIRRCRPYILFEFEGGPSSWHGDDWDAYARFFADRGYVTERLASPMDLVARPQ